MINKIVDDILENVKVLERSEPMKPIIVCPSCFEELNCYYYESKSKHIGDSYCPNCGQKLDWSDSE